MHDKIVLNVNGTVYAASTDSSETLLYFLRDKIGLRATRFGCGQGTCGACTVIIDGESKLSCEIFIRDLSGKNIETAEGLDGAVPHVLIESFKEHQAGQCGYCLPGILMASKALLDANPKRNRREIAEALDGNLCRCGAHARILDAVQKAASQIIQMEAK